jgi:hypothetical protein
VFVRYGEVGATAVRQHLSGARQQFETGGMHIVDHLRWKLTVKQRRHSTDLRRHHIEYGVPLRGRESADPDRHLVRRHPAALHHGLDLTR